MGYETITYNVARAENDTHTTGSRLGAPSPPPCLQSPLFGDKFVKRIHKAPSSSSSSSSLSSSSSSPEHRFAYRHENAAHALQNKLRVSFSLSLSFSIALSLYAYLSVYWPLCTPTCFYAHKRSRLCFHVTLKSGIYCVRVRNSMPLTYVNTSYVMRTKRKGFVAPVCQ